MEPREVNLSSLSGEGFFDVLKGVFHLSQIEITLPDKSKKNYPQGVLPLEIAVDISPGLARKAVAAVVDDVLVDLNHPLEADSTVRIITSDDAEALEILRHTAAHIMAQAVLRLYPGAKLAIGPAISDGFYYDFDLEESLGSNELVEIEAEMERIIAADLAIERREMSLDEAIEFFKANDQEYKVELLEDLDSDVISLYKQGEFVDLCRGPHLLSTGKLPAFKLLNTAGAYWRGDSDRPMLQRIYGTAFFRKKHLTEHLHRLEEAAKRDHRKLGKQLDLFSICDEGPGFPLFHPRGMAIRRKLEDFWRREHKLRGYQEIQTPIILSEELWRQSGHYDHYRENMYFTVIDEKKYAIKPMNCPGSLLVYRRKMHSYKELPLRYAELGLVHRHEMSGVLHGLMRVRNFTQDDAHIFMTPEQIESEITQVMELVDYVYRDVFGFNYHVELSTRPENSMGSDEIWERATAALQAALNAKNMSYVINEGDGAFYGPKIDFHLEDCLGRTWQCGTVQLDFLMPERFDLSYIGEDGQKHRPVMVHRVVFGSLERFIGILIEHFAGAFPLWLAPVQVQVIPVGQDFLAYANNIATELTRCGFDVEVDERDEKVGYKIRNAQVNQVPYMLILGEKEHTGNCVSVRHRRQGDLGTMSLTEFIAKLQGELLVTRRSE